MPLPQEWKYSGAFVKLPKLLFRVNHGPQIWIRTWYPHGYHPGGGIDAITDRDGLLLPRALNPVSYKFPNGLPLHTNTMRLQDRIRAETAEDLCIFELQKGLWLPNDMLLVHDFEDHYSLQPRVHLKTPAFGERLRYFFERHATCFSKEEWLKRYPQSTEDDDINPKFARK